ncbi:MAG: hypothetical protein HRT57_05385 [Crocinitomicaceae bacterium]|nr:hypothetical protein [Crocinitomicaceae bacterium]
MILCLRPTGVAANQWALTKVIAEDKYTFNIWTLTVVGDLNKYGLLDLAIITQDTVCHTGQYQLEVFFTQPNGDKKLVVSSIKAIQPRYPWGKDSYSKSRGYSELSIKRGVLWIETGFIRGHMEHKFRHQNERFKLIGYILSDDAGAGIINIIDYNLSTGHRIEKEGTIGSDDYIMLMDKIIKLNPLPTLDEFTPYDHELY